MPAPLLFVLSCDSSAASDNSFVKFAGFLGLEAESIPLEGDLSLVPPTLMAPAPAGRVLALDATTLRLLFQREWFANSLGDFRFVLVYGFAPTGHESPELKWLTSGAFSAVYSHAETPQRFMVHADVAYGRFPVSGRSYSLPSGSAAAFSGAGQVSGSEAYITVNGRPHFVSYQRGPSLLFLLAGDSLVDIDAPLAPMTSLQPWYASLIALSIMLRTAFGPWCWTSPVTPANFIIDDPYLKKRYGFVRYAPLLREVETTQSALTIAFIPYNHRRSDPQTVKLLRRHVERFSIAVHGCDHTGGEYASLDRAWLTGTTACALDRMENHTRRTGMPFDNVMIFPQGRFSTPAVGALKANGLAAAVNSDPWPADNATNPLTIRDLLQVATIRYENFPIFLRHYPRDVFDCAFDALFQKPVLVVEHHGFFRPGCAPFVSFMREMASLKANLVWMPLGRAIASSCVLRQTGDAQYAVQHLTAVLRLKNPTASDLHLLLEKPESDGSVATVLVDGRETVFEVRSGWLRYEARLAVGAVLDVSVVHRPVGRTARKSPLKFRLAVTARRMLSDVRDNYLARNDRVLRLAEGIKRVLHGK